MLFSKKIIGYLNIPKTSAAEAEGRLLKSFGIGRLCSALVIPCGSGSLLFGQQIVQPNWNGIGPEDLAETVFYSLSTLGKNTAD